MELAEANMAMPTESEPNSFDGLAMMTLDQLTTYWIGWGFILWINNIYMFFSVNLLELNRMYMFSSKTYCTQSAASTAVFIVKKFNLNL